MGDPELMDVGRGELTRDGDARDELVEVEEEKLGSEGGRVDGGGGGGGSRSGGGGGAGSERCEEVPTEWLVGGGRGAGTGGE